MLITEVDTDRVFEINPDGEVVWDWIVERWNKDFVPEIMQGIRYDEKFAAFVNRKKENKK